MKHLNLLFITNLPSFYKINLYNALNKRTNLFVIFTGGGKEVRNDDFFKGVKTFDYVFLPQKPLLKKLWYLYKTISQVGYNELILGGWDSIFLWTIVLCFSKRKNAVVVESSYLESKTNGIKGMIKKIFMKRISKVYASGKAQKDLVKKLGFKGTIVITKGVGLFNIVPQPPYIFKNKVENFLYVGRLSEEKNLKYLVNTFNGLPNLNLNIIGFGPMESVLRPIANRNIVFYGAINNSDLFRYYQENDVFILPSTSEPWGLVVEEALNNGLPVIVSDRVGCADEIIINDKNGIIFQLSQKDSLKNAILKITDISYYNELRKNISIMDFEKNAKTQVECYLKNY